MEPREHDTVESIGGPKKNTRKKKNKGGVDFVEDGEDEQAKFEDAQKKQADMMAAFADDDSDDESNKKKKNNKKDR